MLDSTIKRRAVKGTIWAAIDRFGNMAIQFGVNIVMARLLAPKAFGAIGMLTIFIAVSQTLIDGGFGSALIQKKAPTQRDYCTVFTLSLILAVVLYAILWFISPWVGEWYHMKELCGVLRAIGLMLLIGVVVTLQNNRLRKQLEFTRLAVCNIGSMLVGGAAGLLVALANGGVWALVAMMLTNYLLQAVSLTVASKWIPRIMFSHESLRELFGFGGYMLAASVLQETCKNLQGVIIGRRFSATIMGYYAQAQKLDMICSYSIPQIIVQVMYPVYSSLQDTKEKLQDMLDSNVRLIALLIFPLMAVMITIAPWLIDFLYGPKWMPSVPYFQVFCVGGMFVCLQNVNFYAVAACGHSRILFLWSFYKWGFLLAGLLVGMLFGVYGILWAMVISNFNIYLVNALLARKYVGYTLGRQTRSIMPILLCTLLAFVLGQESALIGVTHPVGQTGIFLGIYVALAFVALKPALSDLKNVAKLVKK